MYQPKIKLISDDGFQQKFEMTSTDPNNELKVTVVHGYRSHNPNNGVGEKFDLKNNAAILDLWKRHIDLK